MEYSGKVGFVGFMLLRWHKLEPEKYYTKTVDVILPGQMMDQYCGLLDQDVDGDSGQMLNARLLQGQSVEEVLTAFWREISKLRRLLNQPLSN